jgi:hypothetical protein
MSIEEAVPIHFQVDGNIYRGEARYYANWYHIALKGRLLKTGGSDYSLVFKELGDDKFAISKEQLEELRSGKEVQVRLGAGEVVAVKPGNYRPEGDGRAQGELF